MTLRPCVLNTCLAALMLSQVTWSGLGHPHHHARVDGQATTHCHSHSHPPAEDVPRPTIPGDEDDCTVCRHLAQASLLGAEVELLLSGKLAFASCTKELPLHGSNAPGLHRPRSPPELGLIPSM